MTRGFAFASPAKSSVSPATPTNIRLVRGDDLREADSKSIISLAVGLDPGKTDSRDTPHSDSMLGDILSIIDKSFFIQKRKAFIMLRQVKVLEGFKLRARDGDIGKVKEFYFDDKFWTVRYLVADTGGWLSGRRVLISPYALHSAIDAEQVLPVDLTKTQIEESPSLTSDEPVSRQYEMQYYGYYGWPTHWNGAYMWGASPYMSGANPAMVPDLEGARESADRKEAWDPNLRSTGDVTGHHIQAQDGEIGHVEDFIIDDETWAIRYLVVDTKNWWPGRHVLVSPRWIDRVSWKESKVFVNLSRDALERSPEYTPESLNRDYEAALHQHYDQQGYWVDELAGKPWR